MLAGRRRSSSHRAVLGGRHRGAERLRRHDGYRAGDHRRRHQDSTVRQRAPLEFRLPPVESWDLSPSDQNGTFERELVASRGVAGDRGQLQVVAAAEYVVTVQTDPAKVADTLLVPRCGVDGLAGVFQQRLLAGGEILDRHGDSEWYALGLGRAGSEAGGDVTANDAALGEQVGPDRPIARIGAGRLLREFAIRRVAGLLRLGGPAAGIPAVRRPTGAGWRTFRPGRWGGCTGCVIGARGKTDQSSPGQPCSDHQLQHASALQQPGKIVVKPSIMVFEFVLAMINTHIAWLLCADGGEL